MIPAALGTGRDPQKFGVPQVARGNVESPEGHQQECGHSRGASYRRGVRVGRGHVPLPDHEDQRGVLVVL